MKHWRLRIAVGALIAGLCASLLGGCVKTYSEANLKAKETRELREEPDEEREEDGIARRVEDEGGENSEAMSREGEWVDEETTQDP